MEFSKVLLDKISYYLRERKETIAVAESVTSGFLQLAFSQMMEAQTFYSGGITAYTLEEKVKQLNIDPEEGKHCDCVSKNIAETMALNVAQKFGTDWSIATTGYATPVPESDYKIYALYCITYKGDIIVSEQIDLHHLTEALAAQQYFTQVILGCLRCEVKRNLSSINLNT